MTFNLKNISAVAKSNICTGCGLCTPVCPEDCISMILDEKKGVYQSLVDLDKCTNCTACVNVCPPITWSNKPKTQIADIRLGDYIGFKSVYSNDENIRRESASGGFITSFLIYLLNEKIIDGAIIAKRNPDNPLTGIPFIARTEKEIKENNTSIYGPVKFDEIIKELIDSNDATKKYALVGLPCHIEGVSRAQGLFKILKKSIYIKIGIVCGQSPSTYAYDYSFRKLKINKNEIKTFQNRGGGWPGFMQIGLKNDQVVKYPYPGKYSMGMVLGNPIYTPTACQKCVDAIGFTADITASDAWLPRYKHDKTGRSFIMIKTPVGKELVEHAISNQIFTVEEISKDDFITANIGVINKAYKGKINSKVLNTKDYKKTYHTEMVFPENIGLKRLMLLYFYGINIFPIHLIGTKKINKLANDYLLFYFKFINLLKKKFINKEYHNKNFQTRISCRILKIEDEANDSKKIYFDKSDMDYQCGQYISIIEKINNQNVVRAYSLASTKEFDKYPYIIVKKIENGKMSGFLTNEISENDSLELILPSGELFNSASFKKDLILVAAGSGVTPLFSILKSFLLNSNRKVVLVYQNRDKESIILDNELKLLKQKYDDRLKIIHVWSREKSEDAYFGYIDDLVLSNAINHINFKDTHYYLCGPPLMMEKIEMLLFQKGINPDRIFKEAFYQSSELKEIQEFVKESNVVNSRLDIRDDDYTFTDVQCEVGQSILNAAKLNDIDIPHSCLIGDCKLCKCKLTEGEVIDKKLGIKKPGDEILTCTTYPRSKKIKIETL